MTDFTLFWPLAKVEKQSDGSVVVSGYASTPTRDLDNEIVSLEAVKKALPSYMEWRNIREMHQPSAVGVAQQANVDEKGLFLTAKITDSIAAKKCLDGVYKGYSIGGKKLAKVGDTITEIELVEISIVDRPANPECRINVAKRAKAGADAHLIRHSRLSPKNRALTKMAQAVEILAKQGEPEPEPKPTPFPVEKAEITDEERARAAQSGAAEPDGSFPIRNKEDLDNARHAFGRSKNKSKTRAHIVARARALGVKLPDKWTKKEAKKLLKEAKEAAKTVVVTHTNLPTDDFPTQLGKYGLAPAVVGNLGSGHEPKIGQKSLEVAAKKFSGKKSLSKDRFITQLREDSLMTTTTTAAPLDELLKSFVKSRASMPRVGKGKNRIEMARAQMKKARNKAKDIEDCMKAAYGALRKAYLAKAGKKSSADEDDGDRQEAMKMLSKAYGDLQALKTFMKAASGQMKKAGRVGQQGEEVNDSVAGVYEVPPGVKDLSVRDLATAGPGSPGERGSEPDNLCLDGPAYKGGMISMGEAEALVRAAAAEAQLQLLGKMPANNARPLAFDTRRVTAGTGDSEIDILTKGVDARDLASNDETTRNQATAKVLGNMILGGMGKSLFSSDFRGGAGFPRT